jgi:hypothetical protein
VEITVQAWKRAPTDPTHPAWHRDTTEARTTTAPSGNVPATPEALPSTPAVSAPQPPAAMSDRLARALRRWGEGTAVAGVGAREHG